MLRTHTCGELRSTHIDEKVTLAGWVHRLRDKGGVYWIDLRDGFGTTQLLLEEQYTPEAVLQTARKLGREFVIRVSGTVIAREAKNPKMSTGDIEVRVAQIEVLNKSETPPFTLEDASDGGEELRMKYRYLDLRRHVLQRNIRLRHRMAQAVRAFLNKNDFLEIETPFLIKSTPEGARDFVVPSRMGLGNFYALPQSPQTFKQLLMVAGFDRYYQIVRCFRDEDLRADRQPEFTQVDCEMTFIEQEDVLNTFERFIVDLFKEIKGVELPPLRRMNYTEAMERYGSDKPDLRFDMPLVDLTDETRGHGFSLFDNSELVIGLCVPQGASYTRKKTDSLSEWVRRPQIGAEHNLVFVRYQPDRSFKSSVDQFYDAPTLAKWAIKMNASPGDMIVCLSGKKTHTRKAMGELRLELGDQLGLRREDQYVALWVVDFPLFEWDDATHRWYAMHHPFTSPKLEDIPLLDQHLGEVRANAYDMVINGVEVGGGSVRIHDGDLQRKVFEKLGLTPEEAERQFGFLTNAFRYGAPPHGGIAFGFDRLCALMGGSKSIRDFIAFPKNNAGRDLMIDSPSALSEDQLKELGIRLT